jgi:hypothetical protein
MTGNLWFKENAEAPDERSQRLVLKEDPCEELACLMINFFPDGGAQTASVYLARCQRHCRMSMPSLGRIEVSVSVAAIWEKVSK